MPRIKKKTLQAKMSMAKNVNLRILKLTCVVQNNVDSACLSDFKDLQFY